MEFTTYEKLWPLGILSPYFASKFNPQRLSYSSLVLIAPYRSPSNTESLSLIKFFMTFGRVSSPAHLVISFKICKDDIFPTPNDFENTSILSKSAIEFSIGSIFFVNRFFALM